MDMEQMNYDDLWSVENKNVPLLLEEVRRGKEQVLWGRLKNGDGWIELKDVQLCENE